MKRELLLILVVSLGLLSSGVMAESAPAISISYKTIPELPEPRDPFILVVTIENAGGTAKSLSAEITEFEENLSIKSGDFYSSFTQKYSLGNLPSGKREMSVRLLATESGIYRLRLTLSYLYGGETLYSESIEKDILIKVIERPKFQIESLSPQELDIGKREAISLSILNFGGDAKNVKIELQTSSGISPEISELYYPSWKKNEVKVIEIPIISEHEAELGSYSVELKISSEDILSNKYVDTLSFTLQLIGEPVIKLGGIYFTPQKISPSESFTMSIRAENIGKSDAKSVTFRLSLPEGFKGDSEYFLGTIEKGDAKTATFDLIAPRESGNYKAKVLISYFDDDMKEMTEEEVISIYVFPEKGSSTTLIIGAIFVALLGVYLWRRRKR
jgi:LPXTG-motif cell wall-anchored protein